MSDFLITIERPGKKPLLLEAHEMSGELISVLYKSNGRRQKIKNASLQKIEMRTPVEIKKLAAASK